MNEAVARPVPVVAVWPLASVLLIGVMMAMHLWSLAAGVHDLAPDEAHYWEWSRRLDWSYYSKGPLVAYLIALSTRLGEPTVFFVRLPAVLLGLGTTLLLYQLTREHAGERAGFLTVLLLSAFPLYNAGSMLMTTDAPLLFFWALLLYSLHRALREADRPSWWWLCGLSLGLGFLGKYSMLLALPCLVLAAPRVPMLRRAVRTWPPYVALLIAALLATPVFVWNMHHQWVSARHVGTLAGLVAPQLFDVASVWKFAGGQLGLVTPLLLLMMVRVLVGIMRAPRRRDDADPTWLLWCLSTPLLLFFLLLSCVTDVEANWAAPAYAGALVLTASWLAAPARGGGTLLTLLVFTGWMVNAAAHCPLLLPSIGINLPQRLDPTARLAGWSADLGAAVGRVQAREAGTFVMSESYQVASALAFYLPGQPRVYNIDLGRRMNQYDVWGGLDSMVGRDGLYVTFGRWDGSHPIRAACASLEPVEVIDVARRGQILRTFSVLRCRGYHGMPSELPRTY